MKAPFVLRWLFGVFGAGHFILMACSQGVLAKEVPLRSLMPKGAFDIHERTESDAKTQLSYKKIVKYPETALIQNGRDALASEGWRQCEAAKPGWQTYPELRDGKSFENHTRIEYFIKDTSVLRLAFFYRLDQSRGLRVTDNKVAQSASIERFSGMAESAVDVARSLKRLGYTCIPESGDKR